MERKTTIQAEEGRQDLVNTREFELPVELLFQAYTEPELFAQRMSTTVLQLESRAHGSYRCETRNPAGAVVLRTHGVFHDVRPAKHIARTFEMEDTPFPAQLEFLDFASLGGERSRLTMHIIYKSAEHRDALLRLPFAQGLNAAHNRLQNVLNNLKLQYHVQ